MSGFEPHTLTLNVAGKLGLGACFVVWAAGMLGTESLLADEIYLKSGKRYVNVKIRPRGNRHVIYFRNGRVLSVANSTIRGLKLRPTSWKKVRRPVPKKKRRPLRRTAYRIKNMRGDPRARLRRPPAPQGWRLSPTWKSTLVPGWGQYSRGARWQGAVFFSGALFLFGRYVQYRQAHTAAEADYNDPAPTGILSAIGSLGIAERASGIFLYLQERERVALRLEDRTNRSFYLLSAVWAWNIWDIRSRVARAPQGSGFSPPSVSLHVGQAGRRLGMRMTVHF